MKYDPYNIRHQINYDTGEVTLITPGSVKNKPQLSFREFLVHKYPEIKKSSQIKEYHRLAFIS